MEFWASVEWGSFPGRPLFQEFTVEYFIRFGAHTNTTHAEFRLWGILKGIQMSHRNIGEW